LRMIAGLEEVTSGDLWLGGTLANDLLSAVTDGARLEVHGGQGRPHVAGIITPPGFRLRRTPTRP
ncbi:hypothetical protein ACFQ08_33780, partial [Streptosporangium algeriense]